MKEYLVQSNREGGNGRYDIIIRSLDVSRLVMVLELKVSDTYKGLDAACNRATVDSSIGRCNRFRRRNMIPGFRWKGIQKYGIMGSLSFGNNVK